MNDRAHEGDRPVDGRDSHHDDAPTQAESNAKTRHERVKDVQSQAYKLYQEKHKIKAESMHHYYAWYKYNHRYLTLKKQMGNMAELLVLDISDTAQLQKASDLLALDTQRANAQLAMTQVLNRIREINATMKKMYLQFAMLVGIKEEPAFAKQMQWYDEQEKKHHEIKRKIGGQMLKWAIGRD